MSETTANLWLIDPAEPRVRQIRWRPLLLGVLIGLVLGVTGGRLAAWASAPEAPVMTPRAGWSSHALDREWRSYRTPVEVDRMFPARRR